VAQAGDGCGNGDGKVESEEGFAAFGLTADDADGLAHPQSLDEPGVPGLLGFGEERGAKAFLSAPGRAFVTSDVDTYATRLPSRDHVGSHAFFASPSRARRFVADVASLASRSIATSSAPSLVTVT